MSERLPRKRGGAQGTPGRTPTPWQCTLSHACHAKEAEPKGRQGVHPTPWQCTLIVPRLPRKMHIVSRLPRKRSGDPRDARAYIRALGSAHCATPATQKRRSPRYARAYSNPLAVHIVPRLPRKRGGAQGTPGRTSDPLAVHIVPRLPRKMHIVSRLPRKRSGDPRDARAYIRPLGSAHCATPATQKRRRPKGRQAVHPTPWQCTLSHACHAKEAETQGTPGRTSDPLAVHIVPRLPLKRGGDPRDARAYIRPAKEAETQGTPGRTSDPLAVHIVPRLPRKRGGDPRDARAYIRPLGSAHCPTPATQKRRRPKGRQGVHPTPWQCTLCHACHSKEAETQGTPGRTSDPQKRRRPKGRQGVHPTPWQCTLCHACHAKEAETQGTPGRTSDPLAVHIVPRLQEAKNIF